jgi:hypothetical protein
MTTFSEEYGKEEYSEYYRPDQVAVLCSPYTFSSGFTMLQYLSRAGATVIGIPSAQAANCFGDTLHFALENSGLSGSISHKQYVYFHNDPERGRILIPDHEVTLEILSAYKYDMNAEILHALDVLDAGR